MSQHNKQTKNGSEATSHTAVAASSTAAGTTTHDQIAQRAYDIYVSKGCQQGHCQQNWRQAEHDLKHPVHTTAGGGGFTAS